MNKEYRLAELFCGPGGLAHAARSAMVSRGGGTLSIKSVWANDFDPDTCLTYAKNIKGAALEQVKDEVHCGDVRGIKDFSVLPDFDALAFGFPCNDFSMVGESKGLTGTFGALYTYGVKAVRAKNPDWFLAENVGGLRSANEGEAFQRILRDLEQAGPKGYELVAHYYKFEDYAVPQARHRVIIVGIRRDLKTRFNVPAPITAIPSSKITCREALTIPPIPKAAGNQEVTRQSTKVVDRLMCIPPGHNAWYLDTLLDLDQEELMKVVKAIPTFRKHFPEARDARQIRKVLMKARLNVKSARMSHIYKRLDPNRPSYTLTGSGGGGTHVYHWSEPRALTNRERARLQTFPDDYSFVGSKESVRKQIGMAVPPKGAQVIFTAVLQSLAGERYASVEENLYRTGTGTARLAEVLVDEEG